MQTLIRLTSFHSRPQPHRILYIRGRLLHFASDSLKIPLERYQTVEIQNKLQLFSECDELMPWLRKKTGLEISTVLSVGKAVSGRSLLASKRIECGDCILKIPYNAHLTPDEVHPEVESRIVDDVGAISRLAVVLLAEQKLGKCSDWYPYINILPSTGNMHNTIFWTLDELKMIQQSSVYHDTLNLKSFLAKEFSSLNSALKHFPVIFGDIALGNFIHAYALVISRAWGTSNGVSLVPFADFLNHDGASDAALLSDDDNEISEVIADRNYSVGEEVVIRYGKFPNSTLMLDYGFTAPHNVYDQVQILVDVPFNDPLYKMKKELIHRHSRQSTAMEDCFSSSRISFIIKEVKTSCRKGRGIPQGLRAFARVITVMTSDELAILANEATQIDGRLARRPLKDTVREIQAHNILLLEFGQMMKCRDAKIEELESSNVPYCRSQLWCRRQMAIDLFRGEIRVLKSASAWMTNYCQSLSALS